MRFTSIQQVIELTGANAKAAECLGKSGALNNLDEGLNEIESAEYARSLVVYFREREVYKERLSKYESLVQNKEARFREKVEERRIKQKAKDCKYEERIRIFEAKLLEIQLKNKAKEAAGKRLTKEPTKPPPPRPLKEITYPKLPQRPEEPVLPSKPRMTLSNRDRIRLQREILHIYLSGHPLDEVPIDKKITEIKDLGLLEHKDQATIYGVLQFMKENQTRTKQLMCRLRLEDKTGSIEVVLFPRVYKSAKSLLEEKQLYKISGQVDITKKESSSGEEFSHTQFAGHKVEILHIGSDKEWDIVYPLLKGVLHILPSDRQKSKGLATTILANKARKAIEADVG